MVYNSKFLKHPGKLRMHWIRLSEIAYVTKGGVVQLKTLKREWKEGLVNGSQLKLYYDDQLPHTPQ
jgi:hypothetical protein